MKIPTAFLFALLALTGAFADESLFVSDNEYDAGSYGSFPIVEYKSTDVLSPRMNVLRSSSECDDSLLTFLSPRGFAVPAPSATILDSKGHLVWFLSGYDQIYNLMVQEYNDEQYLTLWAGNDAVGGHGAGHYYMVFSLFLFKSTCV
jgi:hypothetical protein